MLNKSGIVRSEADPYGGGLTAVSCADEVRCVATDFDGRIVTLLAAPRPGSRPRT